MAVWEVRGPAGRPAHAKARSDAPEGLAGRTGQACQAFLVLARDVQLAETIAVGVRSRLADTGEEIPVVVAPMFGEDFAAPTAVQRLWAWWDRQHIGVELSLATLLIVDVEELTGLGRVAYVAVPPGQVGARSYPRDGAVIEVPAATVGELVDAAVPGTVGARSPVRGESSDPARSAFSVPRVEWRAKPVWGRSVVRAAVVTGALGVGGWLLTAAMQPGQAQAATSPTAHNHHVIHGSPSAWGATPTSAGSGHPSAFEQELRKRITARLRASGIDVHKLRPGHVPYPLRVSNPRHVRPLSSHRHEAKDESHGHEARDESHGHEAKDGSHGHEAKDGSHGHEAKDGSHGHEAKDDSNAPEQSVSHHGRSARTHHARHAVRSDDPVHQHAAAVPDHQSGDPAATALDQAARAAHRAAKVLDEVEGTRSPAAKAAHHAARVADHLANTTDGADNLAGGGTGRDIDRPVKPVETPRHGVKGHHEVPTADLPTSSPFPEAATPHGHKSGAVRATAADDDSDEPTTPALPNMPQAPLPTTHTPSGADHSGAVAPQGDDVPDYTPAAGETDDSSDGDGKHDDQNPPSAGGPVVSAGGGDDESSGDESSGDESSEPPADEPNEPPSRTPINWTDPEGRPNPFFKPDAAGGRPNDPDPTINSPDPEEGAGDEAKVAKAGDRAAALLDEFTHDLTGKAGTTVNPDPPLPDAPHEDISPGQFLRAAIVGRAAWQRFLLYLQENFGEQTSEQRSGERPQVDPAAEPGEDGKVANPYLNEPTPPNWAEGQDDPTSAGMDQPGGPPDENPVVDTTPDESSDAGEIPPDESTSTDDGQGALTDESSPPIGESDAADDGSVDGGPPPEEGGTADDRSAPVGPPPEEGGTADDRAVPAGPPPEEGGAVDGGSVPAGPPPEEGGRRRRFGAGWSATGGGRRPDRGRRVRARGGGHPRHRRQGERRPWRRWPSRRVGLHPQQRRQRRVSASPAGTTTTGAAVAGTAL